MRTLDGFCSLLWDDLDEFGEFGCWFQERLVQFHVNQNTDLLFTAHLEVVMVHFLEKSVPSGST